MVREGERRQLGGALEDGPPLSLLIGLVADDRWRGRLGRDRSVRLADQADGALRLEVAHQDDGGVVRRVVAAEIILAIPRGDGVEVRHPADHRPLVRMSQIGGGLQQLEHRSFDVVVGAQAALLLHDVPLMRQDLLGGRQTRHAVRLQVHHHVQGLRGEVLVVDRQILHREGVAAATLRFEHLVEDSLTVLLRSVEHHVLKQVRDPGPPGSLIARADPEEGVVAHGRDRMVLEGQDLQPVVEAVRDHVEADFLREEGRRPEREEDGQRGGAAEQSRHRHLTGNPSGNRHRSMGAIQGAGL